MTRRTTTLTITALLTGALVLGLALAQGGMGGAPRSGYGGSGGYGPGPGMMGGYGSGGYGYGMMGGYGATRGQALTYDAANAMITASAKGATIDATANTVSYTGSDITLDVIAVQPDKPDTTFEIAGLVDPTVHVPRGATITLNLVNMDYGNDMAHGIIITRLPPPYPYMGTMMAATGGIPPLYPRSSQDLQTASYAAGTAHFRATTPGTYYYLCQVPGHAQKGMYGQIIVE